MINIFTNIVINFINNFFKEGNITYFGTFVMAYIYSHEPKHRDQLCNNVLHHFYLAKPQQLALAWMLHVLGRWPEVDCSIWPSSGNAKPGYSDLVIIGFLAAVHDIANVFYWIKI